MNDEDFKAGTQAVEDFLQALGNPPHLVSIVLADQTAPDGNNACALTTHVSQTLKVPHAKLMLGSILAQLANQDLTKLPALLQMAHEAALAVIASQGPTGGSFTSSANPELN